MTDLQTASYLLINGFHWYLYGRLLTLFLGQRRVGCPAEAAGYLCAYVLNSLCFLLVGVPLLNLASSLLPLLLLSLLYRAPHWQRLWSALVIYAASFLLDTLVFLLMPAHTSQLGNLVSALLLFFMALVLEKRCPSSEKELQPDGPFYWFAVLLIPSTSIAMVILLFYFAHCPAWLSLLVDGMLILLNLLVFHLYRQVGRSYYAQYRARILEQQNQAYANEVALYQCGERELRTLRHDMRNHLAALHLLAGQQDTGALQGYLEQFSKCLEPSALWASSGNPELDSLINFKLAEARRAGAQVRAELRLPAGLSLPLFTVNTILGNLLDNAVEGLARCPQKELSLALWADRGLPLHPPAGQAHHVGVPRQQADGQGVGKQGGHIGGGQMEGQPPAQPGQRGGVARGQGLQAGPAAPEAEGGGGLLPPGVRAAEHLGGQLRQEVHRPGVKGGPGCGVHLLRPGQKRDVIPHRYRCTPSPRPGAPAPSP